MLRGNLRNYVRLRLVDVCYNLEVGSRSSACLHLFDNKYFLLGNLHLESKSRGGGSLL